MTIKIKLIKMGMDFYEGEKWDMGNHRLRPTLDDASNCYLPLKRGGYIAGDFTIWKKNKTNNKTGDRLAWDFTLYDELKQDARRCYLFDKHTEPMDPTLASIAQLLSEVLEDDVIITGVED